MKRHTFITIITPLLSFYFLTAESKDNPALFRSSSVDSIGIYLFDKGLSPYCQWNIGSYYTSIKLNPGESVASVFPKNRAFCLSTMDNHFYGPYMLTQSCIIQTNKYNAIKGKNPPSTQTNITVTADCIPKKFTPVYISSHYNDLIELRFSKYNEKNTCTVNVNWEEEIAGIALFYSNATFIGVDPNSEICVATMKAGFVTGSYGPFTAQSQCALTVKNDGTVSGSSACQ